MHRSLVINLCLTLLLLLPVTASAIVLDPIHDPGNGYGCQNCHMAHVTLGTTGYNNICLDCHKPGVPKGGTKSFVAIDAADPFHIYTAQLPGNRFQTSHRWDGTDTVPSAGAQPPLLEAMTRLDLRGRTKGLLACVSCHSPHSNSSQPFLRTVNDSDQICLDCHRSRNKSSHTAGTHPVNINYSSARSKHNPPINANPANPTSAMKLYNGVVLCTTCHSVHYADSNSATYDSYSSYNSLTPSDGYLLRTDLHGTNGNSLNICTNCHAGKKNHTYRNQNIQCADCHAAHVDFDPQDPGAALGNNSFLVRRYINVSTATGSVRNRRVFLLQTSAAARNYKTVDNTGICQACHTVPTGSFYPAAHSRPTATASDCTVCHYHDNQAGAFSGSGSCDDCHGSFPITGSHTQHAGTLALACSSCHGAVSSNAHIDGNVKWDLAEIGTTAQYKTPGGVYATAGATGNPAPSAAYGSCSNIYCHGASTPVWGSGPLPGGCIGCHGGDAASSAPISTGRHTAHMNNAAVLGVSFGCADCHAKTVSSNTTISNNFYHVNKLVDYSGARAGGSNNYNAGTKQCSNIYCHSNGNGTFVNPPAWTSATTLGCNGCHGSSASPEFDASTTGAPNYVSGGAGSATANSHKQHVFLAGIANTTGCASCHEKVVDPATPGKFKDYTAASYHLNGKKELNFTSINGKKGSFNGSSCSVTYCHGTAASPQWGLTVGVPLPCNTCHSAKANSGYWNTNSAHGIHWEGNTLPTSYNALPGNSLGDASTYRFACSSCHYPGASYAAHANGPANTNGTAQVFFGYTTSTIKGAYVFGATQGTTDNDFNWTNGTGCTSTYCHSNGNGDAGATGIDWATTSSSVDLNIRCNSCHKYTDASASPMDTGSHGTHVSDYGFSCSKCHYGTTSDGSTITDKRRHLNKTKDVSWDPATVGATPYSTPNCTDIYCHSKGTTFSAPYTGAGKSPNYPALWYDTSFFDDECNRCHDYSDIGGDTGPNYPNGSPKANSHYTHVVVYGYVCSDCHNGGNHVNKVYDLAPGGGNFFTVVNGTGNPTVPARCENNWCHGDATWGGPSPF